MNIKKHHYSFLPPCSIYRTLLNAYIERNCISEENIKMACEIVGHWTFYDWIKNGYDDTLKDIHF
jgi:hypothetical protein